MSRRDDDLSPFRDDPVFRALTGPATEAELAGEAEALAAFRSTRPARPRRRFAARIGTSGTVAVATLALSGGVAAAYTASWPAPVQKVLHAALGGIEVPPPSPHHHHHKSGGSSSTPQVAAPAPSVASTPAPTAEGSGTPRARSTGTSLPGGGTPSPFITPTTPVIVTTPTTGPTPTPSHTPLLKGATLDITASETRVPVGTSISITGQLDAADSTPIAGRRVALRERLMGVHGWTRLGSPQITSSTGGVIFTVPPIERNVRLVLQTGRHLHSTLVRVVVQPAITATVTPSATDPGMVTVTAVVQGGEPGDTLVMSWHNGKKHQHVALDATGAATFTVQVPPTRTVHFRLFLRRTAEHASAAALFTSPPT
ncbi:MAG TPA: hypothetical protein VHV76_08175 [Mycobacteriales bacterium]|jgi:uncharacterized protein YndB with AHSA1/START domain|nr:hypothetical protein [Mycobacteriales bacterium]